MAKKEKKEKSKKGNKFVAWVILIFLLVVLLVASFVFGNDLLDVINLSKDKNSNVAENSNIDNSNKEENKISEDTLKKLYNIIGINDDSDACGVQNILTQVSGSINNQSNKDKYELIYFYAYNNKLTTNISSSEYAACEAYGGECIAITKSNYEKIISYYGITDNAEQLFDTDNIYKDMYIFDAPECTIEKYNHDIKYEKVNDDIVVTDNVTIGDEKQTINYTFKLNNNKEYYLAQVK